MNDKFILIKTCCESHFHLYTLGMCPIINLGRAFEARPKVSSEAAFKARPKGGLTPRFCRGYRPGLGPRLQKCGLRLHGPIVARFRPRKKTRPKKPRPKAQRALGRVFRSYGRVFKTRPQKHFFVVSHYGASRNPCGLNESNFHISYSVCSSISCCSY